MLRLSLGCVNAGWDSPKGAGGTDVAGGAGVTPEGGPPPRAAFRSTAGDAGGRTPEPQTTGPAKTWERRFAAC